MDLSRYIEHICILENMHTVQFPFGFGLSFLWLATLCQPRWRKAKKWRRRHCVGDHWDVENSILTSCHLVNWPLQKSSINISCCKDRSGGGQLWSCNIQSEDISNLFLYFWCIFCRICKTQLAPGRLHVLCGAWWHLVLLGAALRAANATGISLKGLRYHWYHIHHLEKLEFELHFSYTVPWESQNSWPFCFWKVGSGKSWEKCGTSARDHQ